MAHIVKLKPLNRYPGDQAVLLKESAVDAGGREWPVGTVFGCVLAAGIDNTLPGSPRYVEVTIGSSGRTKFYGPPQYPLYSNSAQSRR